MMVKHDGQTVKFKYDVKNIYGQDATLRQKAEAVDIREGTSINKKTEWNSINLPGLTVE